MTIQNQSINSSSHHYSLKAVSDWLKALLSLKDSTVL